MKQIAIVSPGLLPIPPVRGGSVETVIQKVAEGLANKYEVAVYGPPHRHLPNQQSVGNIKYFRYSAQKYGDYFAAVRSHITQQKHYSIVQVENRPLFIPKTKAANRNSKFICSLHSLDHIAPKLIAPSVTQQIFRQCDRILVYSHFVKKQLGALYPQIAEKISSVHLAAEAEKFRPRWEPQQITKASKIKEKLGIPADHKVVLFVGRVIPKKGLDILMEAMEEVTKVYSNCALVVVGSNWFGNTVPTDYYRSLLKRASALKTKIIFTNYVYPLDLPQYYAMADVFVCPSQWDEPFGLVNVEAMASGVPVVASKRGGIPEIVDHTINGFLVADESKAASFVQPIVDLLGNAELARKLGEEGRKKAEQYFNWQRVGQEVSEIHDELLT